MEYWDSIWHWWLAFQRSDKIASAALMVAVASLWISWRYGRPQRTLAQYGINKAQKELDQEKQAFIVVQISRREQGYAVMISNSGRSDALNLNFDPGPHARGFGDEVLGTKFPRKRLPASQTVELAYTKYLEDTNEELQVTVTWDDDFKKGNTKTYFPSFPP